MEAALPRQLLVCLRQFLELCQSRTWPDSDTTYAEIQNAFIISQHIEKCMDKLLRHNVMSEFMSVLGDHSGVPQISLKNCLSDPSKYLLKKILVADVETSCIESTFSIFIETFTEQRLEMCLADVMVESASEQTLWQCLPTLPPREVAALKSLWLLNEIEMGSESVDFVDMLHTCEDSMLPVLVECLLIKDVAYHNSLQRLRSAFESVMSSNVEKTKQFWKRLVQVPGGSLTPVLQEHPPLLALFVRALFDCSKLLRESMSAEYFYIDLTYSQLVQVVNKICENQHLKLEFMDAIQNYETDISFWMKMLHHKVSKE